MTKVLCFHDIKLTVVKKKHTANVFHQTKIKENEVQDKRKSEYFEFGYHSNEAWKR